MLVFVSASLALPQSLDQRQFNAAPSSRSQMARWSITRVRVAVRKQVSLEPPSGIPKDAILAGEETESLHLANDLSVQLENGSAVAFALSTLGEPSSVHVRYRMDGRDQAWQDAAPGQRDINYSHLAPGSYRFHLQRAGLSGQWQEEESDVTVYVDPPWWQSRWVKTAAIALAAVGVWLVYRLRTHRQNIALQARLAERVKERTKLAREVQDTILQGAQGLILVLEGISMKLEESDPHRQELETALAGAQRSLGEVRDVVEELQAPPIPVERIEDVLRDLWCRSCAASKARFSIKCQGRPRRWSDFDTSEAIFVATQAIQRACAAPRTRNIDVRISFRTSELKLEIWNDNIGEHDSEPVENDWGLSAMRRRAALCEGTLTFERTRPSGTRLTLTLAARPSIVAPLLSWTRIKAALRL